MLNNTIKYYEKISDEALKNLAAEKKYQFRKMMKNNIIYFYVETNKKGLFFFAYAVIIYLLADRRKWRKFI